MSKFPSLPARLMSDWSLGHSFDCGKMDPVCIPLPRRAPFPSPLPSRQPQRRCVRPLAGQRGARRAVAGARASLAAARGLRPGVLGSTAGHALWASQPPRRSLRFPSPRRCSLRRPTWPPRRRARPGSRRVPPRLLCGEQQQEQAIGSNCMCAAQACATPKEQAALAPVKAGVAKRSQRIAAKVSEGCTPRERGGAAATSAVFCSEANQRGRSNGTARCTRARQTASAFAMIYSKPWNPKTLNALPTRFGGGNFPVTRAPRGPTRKTWFRFSSNV